MSRESVRQVLLKALFEPRFSEEVLTDADKALSDFDLTDNELALFKSRGPEFYGLLSESLFDQQMVYAPTTQTQTQTTVQTTTTNTQVVAVVVVAAIVAFVAPLSPEGLTNERSKLIDDIREQYKGLTEDIKATKDPSMRVEKIMDLISRLSSDTTES